MNTFKVKELLIQSGFEKSYSIDTCLLHMTDYLKGEFDQGNFCGIVMLGLQKSI